MGWLLGCVRGAVRRTNTPTCRASLGVATLDETKGIAHPISHMMDEWHTRGCLHPPKRKIEIGERENGSNGPPSSCVRPRGTTCTLARQTCGTVSTLFPSVTFVLRTIEDSRGLEPTTPTGAFCICFANRCDAWINETTHAPFFHAREETFHVCWTIQAVKIRTRQTRGSPSFRGTDRVANDGRLATNPGMCWKGCSWILLRGGSPLGSETFA